MSEDRNELEEKNLYSSLLAKISGVFSLPSTGAGSAGATQPLKWENSSWQAQLYLSETALLTCQGSCFLCSKSSLFYAVKSKGIVLQMLPAVPGKGRWWWTWKQSKFAWSLVQMLVHMQKSIPEIHYWIKGAVGKQWEIISLLHAIAQGRFVLKKIFYLFYCYCFVI